jgi:F-type H+-transporting ATPase subunit c
MLYLFGLVLGVGFGVAIAAVGCGLAQGHAVAAALEGAARQPEAAGRLTTLMILGLAFIESLTLYAFVAGLLLSSKLPATTDIIKAISAAGR